MKSLVAAVVLFTASLSGSSLSGIGGALAAEDTRATLNIVFAPETETLLALSAAPPHLRQGATVYVYGDKGFTKTKDGANGFTCLLNRDAFLYGSGNFKPTCWDSAGADSYVPVMLRAGEMLAAGKSAEEVQADIARGFKSGKYRRPARVGIAYMLAGDVQLDPRNGKVLKTQFPGHYMIYAPGVSDADVGYDRSESLAGAPLIFAAGAGGAELAYLIVAPHHGP